MEERKSRQSNWSNNDNGGLQNADRRYNLHNKKHRNGKNDQKSKIYYAELDKIPFNARPVDIQILTEGNKACK
jgi:hypothetical protein